MAIEPAAFEGIAISGKQSQEYEIGRSHVFVRIGDLLTSKAQVLVSSDDNKLTMRGGVSGALLVAAGPEYQREAQAHIDSLEIGDVAVTSAGKLPYRHVFHVVTRIAGERNEFDSAQTRAIIAESVDACFRLLANTEIESIAFPAIGTGFAKHSPVDVARAFAAAFWRNLESSARAFRVELYIHPEKAFGDLSFLQFFRLLDRNADWAERVVRTHSVALVHGIRTEALWHERVARLLRDADRSIHAVPIGYGYLDAIRFLLPSRRIRQRLITRVSDQLKVIAATPGIERVSIIAHSFGTHLVANALVQNPELRVKCLVLCGCIVRRDFEWEKLGKQIKYIDRDQFPTIRVINDCGWRDVWPVLAHTFGWGFGSSGRFGFQHASVLDRYHNCRHSDFFKVRFVRKYWISAISEGLVKLNARPRVPSPWFLMIVTVFQLKYVALCAVVVVLFAAFYP